MPHEALLKIASALSPSLPGAFLDKLDRSAEVLSLPAKGTAGFQISDQRLVVFVAQGSVKLVAHVGADREQIVAFGFAGEMIALPLPWPDPYELHALSDSQLIAFRADELARLLNEKAETAGFLLAQITTALDRSRERSVLLGRKTAQERVASFLLDMAERIGTLEGPTVYMVLPMSRREIADSLGLTIETVSRQLSQLRDRGSIRTKARSGVVLVDPKDLCSLSSRVRSFLETAQV